MQLALDKKNLLLVFLFCFLLLLVLPVIEPQINLNFFAPFIIVAIYRRSLFKALTLALICGLILDLFSSFTHFGIYSLDFCLTLFILYPQKRNFFADNISTLPIMTFFFSVISGIILALLSYIIEMKNIVSTPWILTDLVFMPAIDSFYAFTCFTLPSLIFGKRQRRGKDYFS